jgi:hypothetical protein
MFLDVHHLFICRISADSDIKNPKICLPIMLGAILWLLGEKSPRGNILFSKRNILLQFLFFLKNIQEKS